MSIRLRIALWYASLLGASLLAFGLLLYSLMGQHSRSTIDSTIATRAEHIVTTLTLDSSKGFVLPPLDAFESPGVFVQVVAPTGQVIGKSANLGAESLPLADEMLTPPDDGRPSYFDTQLAGNSVRVFVASANAEGAAPIFVLVGMSTGPFEQSQARLRLILLLGGAVVLAIAALVGRAIARRALAPISEITETARAIALSQGFSRRLEQRGLRDEVGVLITTFNDMLASLEAAYEAQRRFVADASHELRAPLTTIRGNLELLGRIDTMPPNERTKAVSDARQEADRLSRLVSDLLAIARADAGQRPASVSVQFDELVMDVYRQALRVAQHVGLSIEGLEPISVAGDRDWLRQLVVILTDNAFKYTPEGGKVVLRLAKEDDWAVFQVKDTGIGIGDKDLPHIFDRFFRADKARARDPGGSGLGLSIARWIVEQHGGEITVESNPGEGSTFAVKLPMA